MLKNRKKKGFTLIELIVVIAILGILAVVALPKFAGTLTNAKTKTHNANIRTIESALSVYAAEKGVEVSTVNDIEDIIPEYLKENPDDPTTDTVEAGYKITAGVVSAK